MLETQDGYSLEDAIYDELNGAYGSSKAVTLSDGRQIKIELLYDDQDHISYDEFWGKLFWSKDRPSDFDGASRKIHTERDTLWWQPPDDVKGNAEQTKSLQKRIQEYFYNEWCYLLLHVVEYSAPCSHCGEQKETKSEYVGGIESDISESDLLGMVNDILGE